MSRRRRTWLIGGVLVLSAFLSGRASPAIAVTFDGVYVATLEVGSTTETCELTVVQTGSDLTLSGSGCEPVGDVSATGTMDSVSGAFNVSGHASTFCDAPGSLTITGTVTPGGTSFSGTVTCYDVIGWPISGVRVRSVNCGDGVVDPDEACDPGPFPMPGTCCSDACSFLPDGAACLPADSDPCRAAYECAAGACESTAFAPAGTRCNVDGNRCTDDRCDGAGDCTGPGPAVDCGPCSECDAARGCRVPTPRATCLGPAEPSATLKITDKLDTAKTVWSWGRGSAILPGSFGDPTGGTSYEVCVLSIGEFLWDPVLLLEAPTGTGWRPSGNGFRFQAKADGLVTTIAVKPSAVAGGSRIKIKHSGPLDIPGVLRISGPPWVVELRGSDGSCYGATFDAAGFHTPERLRARDGRAP